MLKGLFRFSWLVGTAMALLIVAQPALGTGLQKRRVKRAGARRPGVKDDDIAVLRPGYLDPEPAAIRGQEVERGSLHTATLAARSFAPPGSGGRGGAAQRLAPQCRG